MSAYSNAVLDLSHRDDLRWLAQLVADVHSEAPSVEPLLVGALARDLLLHYGHDIAITRATRDADFAIAVADWQEFESVRDALLAAGHFTPYKSAIHKLRYGEHGWIDLLPFGAIERPDGTIAWPPNRDEVMSVIGYREASATATEVLLPLTQKVRVVSLPMLAVLKLFAWQDRHAFAPGKDAVDLMLILRNYLDAGNVERLYNSMTHLLNDDFDYERTSAWLAGSDARELVQEHSSRAELIFESMATLLLTEIDEEGQLTLITQMDPNDPGKAQHLLEAFRKGFAGNPLSA